jgi:inosine-uridine nucleoside N-ribohydrolase
MQRLLNELRSAEIKNVILDTDTYNEVDDQFALAYAMLSPERINLLSVNAAPFLNSRSTSPADGMEKSYNEIFNIISLVDSSSKIPVYRGSTSFLKSKNEPIESEAADNIINTVVNSKEKIYIVAIGAITNVASALIKCPEVAKKAALIWLGGASFEQDFRKEFNLMQDVLAAQVVFDSGIELIQLPCHGVVSEFLTTSAEVNYYLKGKNDLCDYLANIVENYPVEHNADPYGYSKVIWDVTAVAALALPSSLDMVIVPTPYISMDCSYVHNMSRHKYIYVRKVRRDPLYADLFKKLANK